MRRAAAAIIACVLPVAVAAVALMPQLAMATAASTVAGAKSVGAAAPADTSSGSGSAATGAIVRSRGPRAIVKPHLSGVFLDITPVTATWSESQWVSDLQAMKDVGMTFFVIHWAPEFRG